MTDLEISKALALAIGHPRSYVNILGGRQGEQVWVQTLPGMAWSIRVFDYRDWNVIGPIAAKYDAFPKKSLNCDLQKNGWASPPNHWSGTPQKAIAMAVIGAKK